MMKWKDHIERMGDVIDVYGI